ncbi:MAG: Gfo/Idh/MocA family protein [Myxococcota bacterium]
MRDKIRVGIIGMGYMGNIHLSKLSSNPDCVVNAIYDIDKRRYSVIKDSKINRCRRVEEILRYSDAVVIASPSITHLEYLKFFLSNGIHCLCEKPPVIYSKDLTELNAIAKEKNIVFNVVMPEKENPVVKYIMQTTENKGYVFQSDRVAPFSKRSTDISVLYDIMIHDIDILLRIIPFRIKRVNATGLSVLTGEVDILNVRIEYNSGSFAILNASRLAMEKKRRIRIFYKGGYISADLLNLTYSHILLRRKNMIPQNHKFNLENSDPINLIDKDFIEMILLSKLEGKYSASNLVQTIGLCNYIERKIISKDVN